jgi:hypothetical protein
MKHQRKTARLVFTNNKKTPSEKHPTLVDHKHKEIMHILTYLIQYEQVQKKHTSDGSKFAHFVSTQDTNYSEGISLLNANRINGASKALAGQQSFTDKTYIGCSNA